MLKQAFLTISVSVSRLSFNMFVYVTFRSVIKGKTPKNASMHVNEQKIQVVLKKVYVCGVCGCEYPDSTDEFEQLNDYTCPICGAPKNKFKLQ